jgi:uncharacterized repeat protein (TIGR01451 family)
MKRALLVLAVVAACQLALVGTAFSGTNGNHKIAVHVVAHGTECKNLPTFDSCSDIQTTYPAVGDIDVIPVFYDLTEYMVIQFGFDWPQAWGDMEFMQCVGDGRSGSIVSPGDGMAIVWSQCQRAWSVAGGYGRIDARGPGRISLVPYVEGDTQAIGVSNCDDYPLSYFDYPSGISNAGVGGIQGDDPCAPAVLYYALNLRVGRSGGCVNPGDTLTYTVAFDNKSNSGAVHGIALVDNLPEATVFVSASSGGLFDAVTRTITWQIGTLAPNATGSATARIAVGSEAADSLVNVCRLSGNEVPDTTAAKTTRVCLSTYSPLNLSIGVPMVHCVDSGAQLTYELSCSNSPNARAVHNVMLVDSLPAQTCFESASAGGVYSSGNHTVTWQVDSLAARAGVSRIVTVTVSAPPGSSLTDLWRATSNEAPPSVVSHTLPVCGSIGGSPLAKIAVHVKAHPTACTKGYPTFPNCSAINYTYAGNGDVDALPVFFDLGEYSVVECGLTWPEAAWGSGSWALCKGDLAIGSIAHSADLTGPDSTTQGVVIAWMECQSTWAISPGYVWLAATGPGRICPAPSRNGGAWGVVGCQPAYSTPVATFCAGVAGLAGDMPCSSVGVQPATWGSIKAMFK